MKEKRPISVGTYLALIVTALVIIGLLIFFVKIV